jgi:hypothetical protein
MTRRRGPYVHVPTGETVQTQHDAGEKFYDHRCLGTPDYGRWNCSSDNRWWGRVQAAMERGELMPVRALRG